MRAKIIHIVWIILTLAVFAAFAYIVFDSGRKEREAAQDIETANESFLGTAETELETNASQEQGKGEDMENNVITDQDELVIGDLVLRPVQFCMVDSISDIENDTLQSMLEEAGGLEDRFMYGYYELELCNTGDNDISVLLSNTTIAMMDSDGELCSWLEPMYFEYSMSERCQDSGKDTEIVLEPGECYQTGIVALEYDETLVGLSYYLVYNPYGHELDVADTDIYYLCLQ